MGTFVSKSSTLTDRQAPSPDLIELAARPTQHISLDGRSIAYRHAGDGPPLLLIHGWASSSRYWAGTISHFADAYSVYAPDMPGFGESTPLSAPIDVDRMADEVIAFADALGLQQFDLNGHSFGAAVATSIAARYPDRINRLILACLSAPRNPVEFTLLGQAHCQAFFSALWMRPWLTVWKPWIEMWKPWVAQQWSTPPVARTLASRFFYQTPENTDLLSAGVIDLVRMDARVALESAASAGDPGIIAALRTITAPTLVVGGDSDLIMPPSGVAALAQLTPNSRLAWVEQCGHVPMVEQPDAYHGIVRDFLAA